MKVSIFLDKIAGGGGGVPQESAPTLSSEVQESLTHLFSLITEEVHRNPKGWAATLSSEVRFVRIS